MPPNGSQPTQVSPIMTPGAVPVVFVAQPPNNDAVIAQIAALLCGPGDPADPAAAVRAACNLIAHAQLALATGLITQQVNAGKAAWGLQPPSEEDDAREAEARRLARLQREQDQREAEGPTGPRLEQ